MRKDIVRLFLLVLCLVPLAVKAYAYSDGDFQIWHTEGQEIGIGKGTKITAEEEWRFGEDSSELFYQHYDWGVVYAFDKRLELGANYRLVYDKYKRNFREERRPHLNAAVKLDLWKFKFEDRNRLEFRIFRYKDDFIRYRNKATLKFPFDFHTIKVAPYISDEIFIASNSTGFNANRFYAGIEFGLTKYVKSDVYYMLHSTKGLSDKWIKSNILGLKLKVAF